MPPEYVGFKDLPGILGVARATAARLTHEEGFPKPVKQSFSPHRVWRRSAVERWAEKHPPRPPHRPRGA
jgi:predicted DNA-binding transcriptional regulator AlpA